MMIPKRFVILLTIFFLTSCSGTKTEFWPNGNKKSEVGMNGDKYEGAANYWHENGKLQTSCTYRDNLIDGMLRNYYPSGLIQVEQHFKKGVLDGPVKTWDKFGKLMSEGNYRDGLLHGRYAEYYPDKALKLEGNYINGNHEGIWLYYASSGLIIGEGTFAGGAGIQKSYYENGATKQLTHYKGNEKDGEEIFYKPDGSTEVINFYEHGKLVKKIKK
jgi:antitoxin component YwqK of YwqJK toxin-antitoxin module